MLQRSAHIVRHTCITASASAPSQRCRPHPAPCGSVLICHQPPPQADPHTCAVCALPLKDTIYLENPDQPTTPKASPLTCRAGTIATLLAVIATALLLTSQSCTPPCASPPSSSPSFTGLNCRPNPPVPLPLSSACGFWGSGSPERPDCWLLSPSPSLSVLPDEPLRALLLPPLLLP